VKPVLQWIKSNPIIVVCCVVILASIPVAYVISSGMTEKLKADQQKTFDDSKRKLGTQLNVTYEVPAFGPFEQRLSHNALPNEQYQQWASRLIQARRDAASRVAEQVVAFNRRDHAPLEEGLFPAPVGDVDQRVKPRNFLSKLIGSGGTPSAYTTLLAKARPVQPPTIQEQYDAVIFQRDQFIRQRIELRGPGELTEAEQTQLRELLTTTRLARSQRRAESGSVYAPPTLLLEAARRQAFGLPAAPPAQGAWDPVQRFADQFDYWTLSELVNAIAGINEGRPIPDAPIKRLVAVELEMWPGRGVVAGRSPQDRQPGEDDFDRGPATIPEVNGIAGVDPRVSRTISGRVSNPWYEVRHVKVGMIVSSRRLPVVLERFSEQNFISVLDVDVEQIDPWEHAREGYVYGPEHVVRADVRLEIVFLRSWMVQYMPREVRQRLGIQDDTRRGS